MHKPCRERIYAFRNLTICSNFDCSAHLQGLPPPDGGGAPEGRRERKSWQFLPENIRFFRIFKFSPVAAFACRTFGSPSYLSLSGSAAAPPSGGAKTWPCRAARRSRYILRTGSAGTAKLGTPRPAHTPCRERIYAFRNLPICSDFDCSARLQVLPPPDGAMSST